MTLKGKITDEVYGNLDETLQVLYKKVGDNYVLEVEGMQHEDDIVALKSAKDRETKNAREWKAKVDSLQAKLAEANKAVPNTAEEIIAQWKQKFEARETELLSQLAEQGNKHKQHIASKEAESLAHELFVSPKLGLPHLLNKLIVEETDAGYATKVLGDDGKPSIKTLADFKKEIIANPDFKYILKGNQASGGAAQPNGSSASFETTPFSKMPAKEAAQHILQKHPQILNKT